MQNGMLSEGETSMEEKCEQGGAIRLGSQGAEGYIVLTGSSVSAGSEAGATPLHPVNLG